MCPFEHASRRRRAGAFTLVELLVVIGIIAVLVGVLLPVLSKARERGRTIACAANLRQIVTAAMNYAAEYKGALPYGFVFNKQSATGRPVGGDSSYITWFSAIDHYMNRKSDWTIPLNAPGPFIDGGSTRRFNLAFKCPSAPTNEFRQQVQYYNHGVAMPHMGNELKYGPGPAAGLHDQPAILGPARLEQCYPETALFWDTPMWLDAIENSPAMFWVQESGANGFELGTTRIDGGQLIDPSTPELRYRGPGGDRFANSTDPFLQPSGPINLPTEKYLSTLGQYEPGDTFNQDVIGKTWNYGGPRFRHSNNTACNVAFVDGTVRTMTYSPRHTFSHGTAEGYDTDFRRYMIMIKWPNNKRDSNIVPTG